MPLTLTITNAPAGQSAASPTYTLHEMGGTIGRKPENDWTLPDPERFISSRHAAVRYMDGSYYLDDLSSNGTFLNDGQQAIGRGNAVRLSDGDKLYIGDYEISVAIAEAPPPDPFAGDPFAPTPAQAPAADPYAVPGGDPYNMPPEPPAPDYAPPAGAPQPYAPLPEADGFPGNAAAPDDPMASFEKDDPAGSGLAPLDDWPQGGASMPDHSPAASDAFVPPTPDSQQIPDDFDPMKTSFPTPARAPTRTPTPTPTPAPSQPPAARPPVAPPPAYAAPPQQPAPAMPPGPGDMAALAALLDGAGLSASRVPPGSADVLMHVAGQIFREVVAGMMEVLRARADLKSEFRMQLTTIAPQENNPLKFAVNVDDALDKLLFNESQGYLPPVQAVQEGFHDIRAHQMAMMAGMRAAFQSVLAQFDPDKLSARFDRESKRGGLLGMGGKSRYWESFGALYEEMTRDPEQCFRSLFGDEFSRAYEEQMARLSGGKR